MMRSPPPDHPPVFFFGLGPDRQTRFPAIHQTVFAAGKHPRCALRLHTPRCNNTHARFAWQEQRLFITDNDSVNGVWLNGARIARNEPHPLAEDDVLEIGGIRLQIRFHDEPPAPGPNPSPERAPPSQLPSPGAPVPRPPPLPIMGPAD